MSEKVTEGTFLDKDSTLANVKARIAAGILRVLLDTASEPLNDWVKEEVYITHDYPLGRRANTRGTMRWGIEHKRRYGVRILRASKNRYGKWRGTKRDTYNRRIIVLEDTEQKRAYFLLQGNLGSWSLIGGALYSLKSYYSFEDDPLFALPERQPEPDPEPEPEPTAFEVEVAAGQVPLW